MNRRKFCASSAAIAAGFAASRVFPSRIEEIGSVPAAPFTLHEVIFDTRFSASRAFGMAAASAGRKTVAIRGDVTALWFEDLRLEWAAGGGTIAGMTTSRSLFCLEQLAKDHWMRVIVRAEHGRSDAAASARRVRRIVGGAEGDRSLPADPELVSWIIAA